MEMNKQSVSGFWKKASCGEILYLTQVRQAKTISIATLASYVF